MRSGIGVGSNNKLRSSSQS